MYMSAFLKQLIHLSLILGGMTRPLLHKIIFDEFSLFEVKLAQFSML